MWHFTRILMDFHGISLITLMLSRAGWIISTLRYWEFERNVVLGEQFQPEKIVPSKSQNITDILTLFWFWKNFFDYSLKIPFNCDWNVWGYWIILENQTCNHLRVRLRLRTAPSHWSEILCNKNRKVELKVAICFCFYDAR